MSPQNFHNEPLLCLHLGMQIAGTKLANRFILNSEHNIYTTGSKGVRLLLYRVYLGTQHIGPRPTGSFCSTALCIWVCMFNSEVSKWRVGAHCVPQIDSIYHIDIDQFLVHCIMWEGDIVTFLVHTWIFPPRLFTFMVSLPGFYYLKRAKSFEKL